jgi:flagellar hook-associated protein 3 FlgL
MISGIAAFTSTFLTNLNTTEQRIGRDDQQLSSGVRVSVASDDPHAVAPLLDAQNEVAQLNQTVSNLQDQQTIAQTADNALQTASSLLNQLISLGTQGATATQTANSRAAFAQQVQEIERQLVAIANTSVQGRYVFGGDSVSTQPYTFDWSNPGGVVSSGSPTNTLAIYGVGGSSLVPGLTAGQIFDLQLPSSGGPDPANVFQAAYQLGTALLANDQTGIQTAVTSLQAAATHVSQCATAYGNTETWISQEIATANSRITDLTAQVSTLRDTDVAAAATDLSQGQVALNAALAAEASLPTKSLFSYLG